MAREWTDEEVQREIADAVKIVREDRERAQYASLHERYGKSDGGDGGNPGGGKTPPAKDPSTAPTGDRKRKGIWWGESND